MRLTRRRLLMGGGAAVVGAAIPLQRMLRRGPPGRPGRWGPLLTDPAGILDLPAGFSYVVLQRKGDRMSDNVPVPGAFDGMACFATPGRTLTLMRNHELDGVELPSPSGSAGPPLREAYDPDGLGGVTRVVLDARSLRVLSSNLVLTGTVRNCAGGKSPWGWLSCEETTVSGHGYVFRCNVDAQRVEKPVRLRGLGRFRHEAACVDPETQIVYLTEDRDDGALYRFVPEERSPLPPTRGVLQAMRVIGSPRLDTATNLTAGATFPVEWVDVPDPDPKEDTVRHQARDAGAALVRRGEGIWFDKGSAWFTSTTGGPVDAGQVFRLDIGRAGRRDQLHLVAQSDDTRYLDMPDNVTVAPWGDVFLCEDSVLGDQYVRVVDAQGHVGDFARNAISQSELAGGCFSPDGRTFFVNIYGDGLTLAVTGPFQGA
jgi:secreted PhoX family phosphatase